MKKFGDSPLLIDEWAALQKSTMTRVKGKPVWMSDSEYNYYVENGVTAEDCCRIKDRDILYAIIAPALKDIK